MSWNAASPDGAISVRANRTQMNNNNTYIQTTMGNSVVGTNTVNTRDHFWNVGSNEDGRHRFIQSPKFTVGGLAADPVLGTGMNSVLYAKETSSRVEWFHRNAEGIYQFIPSLLSGTKNVTDTPSILATVPTNVYGEIFMFRASTDGSETVQTGVFKSTASGLAVVAVRYTNSSSDQTTNLKFSRSGLDIFVSTDDADSGNNWEYRITYRAN